MENYLNNYNDADLKLLQKYIVYQNFKVSAASIEKYLTKEINYSDLVDQFHYPITIDDIDLNSLKRNLKNDKLLQQARELDPKKLNSIRLDKIYDILSDAFLDVDSSISKPQTRPGHEVTIRVIFPDLQSLLKKVSQKLKKLL